MLVGNMAPEIIEKLPDLFVDRVMGTEAETFKCLPAKDNEMPIVL